MLVLKGASEHHQKYWQIYLQDDCRQDNLSSKVAFLILFCFYFILFFAIFQNALHCGHDGLCS